MNRQLFAGSGAHGSVPGPGGRWTGSACIIIIACRFIPDRRTAVTLTCGLIGYPRRRFVIATAVAGIVWASHAFFLGRLGGKAFEDRPWIGLLLALGLALAVSVLVAARRLPMATAVRASL